MALTSLIAYARRGYSTDKFGVRRETTFVSADRADDIPMGWVVGWFADGAAWENCELVHVYTRSWRVSEPQALSAQVQKAA